LFITFEGPEGSGKSLQARRLAEVFRGRGWPVLLTREPGGTPISDQIRQIVLAPDNTAMTAQAEILLYSAARAQHVWEKVRPALDLGQIVLCDRFADSTYAYQGYGLGLDLDALRYITQFATGGLTPDVTVYLDCPVSVGLDRKRQAALNSGGDWDRLDRKPVEYHARVRQGYLELAAADSSRWLVIDACPSPDIVATMVRTQVDTRLEELWTPPTV
jgi:dTMP kinase